MADHTEPSRPSDDAPSRRSRGAPSDEDHLSINQNRCPYAAVLAGGVSKRMGRDKARVAFGATTLLERAIDLAAGVADNVLVVGREPDDVVDSRATVIADAWPGKGPLGGIATALEHSRPHACLILPCDMPLLTTELLLRLIEHHGRGSSEATLVGHPSGDEFEPLVGVYEAVCLRMMRIALEAGSLAIRYSLDRLAVGLYRIDPGEKTQLININTPDDLARLTGRTGKV